MTAAGGPMLVMVVAVANNGIIGREGDLPWRLPSDLKRFRALTMGKPVLMGRRTFDSIGRPLDGRTNIVISRDPAFAPKGVTVVSDPDAALEAGFAAASASGACEVAVIGGGAIYAAMMPRADRLYVTHVAVDAEGDTRFPVIEPATWSLTSEEVGQRTERDTADVRYAVYERRRDAQR